MTKNIVYFVIFTLCTLNHKHALLQGNRLTQCFQYVANQVTFRNKLYFCDMQSKPIWERDYDNI